MLEILRILQQSSLVGYIDPGAGGILAQVILGGVAGLALVVKMYWGWLKDRFTFSSKKSTER